MIKISNLQKSFDQNPVLDNISIDIKQGEKIVIMGPSGCGKSTLLNILATLQDFQAGKITIQNNDLKHIKPISKIMGMVFQSFNLFNHMNVFENLIFAPYKIHKQGNKKDLEAKALETLNKFGLSDQKYQSPKTLSGGQKQRVAIARAFMLEPEILLFDEPTSALDPEMSQEVLKAMRDLSKSQKTILCVTHEVEFAKSFADKILFLDKGQILFFDETQKFFTSNHQTITKFLSVFK